jgi:hypothetical protein
MVRFTVTFDGSGCRAPAKPSKATKHRSPKKLKKSYPAKSKAKAKRKANKIDPELVKFAMANASSLKTFEIQRRPGEGRYQDEQWEYAMVPDEARDQPFKFAVRNDSDVNLVAEIHIDGQRVAKNAHIPASSEAIALGFASDEITVGPETRYFGTHKWVLTAARRETLEGGPVLKMEDAQDDIDDLGVQNRPYDIHGYGQQQEQQEQQQQQQLPPPPPPVSMPQQIPPAEFHQRGKACAAQHTGPLIDTPSYQRWKEADQQRYACVTVKFYRADVFMNGRRRHESQGAGPAHRLPRQKVVTDVKASEKAELGTAYVHDAGTSSSSHRSSPVKMTRWSAAAPVLTKRLYYRPSPVEGVADSVEPAPGYSPASPASSPAPQAGRAEQTGLAELNAAQETRGGAKVYRFYHGTSWETALQIQAEGFKPSQEGCLGPGVYVARKEKAEKFAKDGTWHGGRMGGLVELLVEVKNPKFVEINRVWNDSSWRDEGFDACRADRTTRSENMEWCIADRTQVTVLQIYQVQCNGLADGGMSGAAVAEEMNDMDVGEEMGMCID